MTYSISEVVRGTRMVIEKICDIRGLIEQYPFVKDAIDGFGKSDFDEKRLFSFNLDKQIKCEQVYADFELHGFLFCLSPLKWCVISSEIFEVDSSNFLDEDGEDISQQIRCLVFNVGIEIPRTVAVELYTQHIRSALMGIRFGIDLAVDTARESTLNAVDEALNELGKYI